MNRCKPAAPRDQLVARAQIQVIRVAEDDLRARFLEVALAHRLDAPLGADRHERRRLDQAMRRVHLAEAGAAIRAEQRETES